MWKYFDPDSNTTFTEPVKSVILVEEPLLKRNKPPQVRNACIIRNHRYKNIYFKLFRVFRENKKKWDRYHKVEAKLKKRIQSMVAQQKKTMMRSIYLVQLWLTVLRDSMTLSVEIFRFNIQLEYQKLIGNTNLDWPTDGPTIWLSKWEEIINKAE